MINDAYVVYYINEDGYQYCVSSGRMDFTTNINNAYQYSEEEAINISNYFRRTNKCQGCEIGYLKIVRSIGEKTIIKEC